MPSMKLEPALALKKLFWNSNIRNDKSFSDNCNFDWPELQSFPLGRDCHFLTCELHVRSLIYCTEIKYLFQKIGSHRKVIATNSYREWFAAMWAVPFNCSDPNKWTRHLSEVARVSLKEKRNQNAKKVSNVIPINVHLNWKVRDLLSHTSPSCPVNYTLKEVCFS